MAARRPVPRRCPRSATSTSRSWCFFFDEAHLLFEDAPKEFLDQVAQTVRLIRSKGVGVFFVTQLPDDVPDDVLAQLGNRVQHALRAFTPRDAKALKAAVTTYPKTDDYDLEEDLTQLGIGEAMVTILSRAGRADAGRVDAHAAADVAHGRDARPPRSTRSRRPSPLWAEYAQEIDPESAREKLAAKLAASGTDDAGARDRGARRRRAAPAEKAQAARRAGRSRPRARRRQRGHRLPEVARGPRDGEQRRARRHGRAQGLHEVRR